MGGPLKREVNLKKRWRTRAMFADAESLSLPPAQHLATIVLQDAACTIVVLPEERERETGRDREREEGGRLERGRERKGVLGNMLP